MANTSALQQRRAFTVTEVIVSMILLGTAIGIIAPLAKRAIDVREQAQLRRTALIELSNTLERLELDAALGPAPGQSKTLDIPSPLARRLKNPELIVAATALDDDPAGVRLDAVLSWTAPNGRQTAPLRLSAFVFEAAPAGGSP